MGLVSVGNRAARGSRAAPASDCAVTYRLVWKAKRGGFQKRAQADRQDAASLTPFWRLYRKQELRYSTNPGSKQHSEAPGAAAGGCASAGWARSRPGGPARRSVPVRSPAGGREPRFLSSNPAARLPADTTAEYPLSRPVVPFPYVPIYVRNFHFHIYFIQGAVSSTAGSRGRGRRDRRPAALLEGTDVTATATSKRAEASRGPDDERPRTSGSSPPGRERPLELGGKEASEGARSHHN